MAFHLLAATTSQGKLRDFRTAAAAHSVEIQPIPGLEKIPAPEENGTTFAANAELKAIYYSKFAPGELVVADDSGLEVDALGGAPGVRSARFAADAGLIDSPDANDNTDVWNNMLLLQRLAAAKTDNTQAENPQTANPLARYRCVLACARGGQILHTAEGRVEGVILSAPRGTGGFGYDPLFYLPELDRTMAEIDLETKHRLSHRGLAFVSLLKKIGAWPAA